MRTASALVIVGALIVAAGWVDKERVSYEAKAAAVRELSDYINRAQRQRIEALTAENALLRMHGDPAKIRTLREREAELTSQIEEAVGHGCSAVSDVFCTWPK